jgi:hypothetical protein
MKQKIKIVLSCLCLLSAVVVSSCDKNYEDDDGIEIVDTRGIAPQSIEDVVDVFELKYGENKKVSCNGKVFTLSIADIEDHLHDCSAPNYDAPFLGLTLKIKVDSKVIKAKITSNACVADYTEDNPFGLSYVKKMIEGWKGDSFASSWARHIGAGVSIEEYQISICIVQPYTLMHHHQEGLSAYKFILAITNNNQ